MVDGAGGGGDDGDGDSDGDSDGSAGGYFLVLFSKLAPLNIEFFTLLFMLIID